MGGGGGEPTIMRSRTRRSVDAYRGRAWTGAAWMPGRAHNRDAGTSDTSHKAVATVFVQTVLRSRVAAVHLAITLRSAPCRRALHFLSRGGFVMLVDPLSHRAGRRTD